MEKKIFACGGFLCLLFLNAVHGEKWEENAKAYEQCSAVVPMGGCENKKCLTACKQQYQTTQLGFCLPGDMGCQCYYSCDKGNVTDCYYDLLLEGGCDNSKCSSACLNVRGAVAGSCLNGNNNHACRCYIPC